jgi:hypothetical protein
LGLSPNDASYLPETESVDKREFVKLAPRYYALAILQHLRNRGAPASESSIQEGFKEEGDEGNSFYYVDNEVLFDQALQFIVDAALITVIRDPFGPLIIRAVDNFYDKMDEILAHGPPPFQNYGMVPDREEWLRNALLRVNRAYEEFGIKSTDFDEKEPDEWEPLPLERGSNKLEDVVNRLDETIETLRSDNGYSVTAPEEKSYVLDGLSNLRRKLSDTTTVSYGYVKKYGMEPLRLLINRFGPAAIGVAAMAAREAIISWLKELGVRLLDSIF